MNALPVWVQYASIVGQFFVLVVLVPLVRAFWAIRLNDLAHMAEAIHRVEVKIDAHTTWHLDQATER